MSNPLRYRAYFLLLETHLNRIRTLHFREQDCHKYGIDFGSPLHMMPNKYSNFPIETTCRQLQVKTNTVGICTWRREVYLYQYLDIIYFWKKITFICANEAGLFSIPSILRALPISPCSKARLAILKISCICQFNFQLTTCSFTFLCSHNFWSTSASFVQKVTWSSRLLTS